MMSQKIKAKPTYSREIINKLQKDLEVFDSMMKERMQLMKDEVEELAILNNKELIDGLKNSEDDFKSGRFVRCNTKDELEKHLEAL